MASEESNDRCEALRLRIENLIEERDAVYQALYETQRRLAFLQAKADPLSELVLEQYHSSRKSLLARLVWNSIRLHRRIQQHIRTVVLAK